jgi:hypothetical protein
LEQAITSFQQVQRATSDLTLLQQAGFGLAQCWETLAAVRSENDLAKAEEEDMRIAERWGDGFMGQRAQQQLALIRQPTTRMFLERMAAKTAEVPAGMEGFDGVTIDPDAPFSPGALDFGRFGWEEIIEEGQSTEMELETDQEPESDNMSDGT